MSTKSARILVLVCSTRPGALGPSIGHWFVKTTGQRATELDAELVPVSLGDLDLPFLDEEEEPHTEIYRHEHTGRWSALVNSADGFVVVTPEYNHSMPATLKNALDYLSSEWAWKPVGFVSYGNTSAGTRAVQHAKQVVTSLCLVPLGSTVALRISESVEDGQVRPGPGAARAAVGVLDELVRAAHALRPMREHAAPGHVTGPLPGSYLRPLTRRDTAEVLVLQRCCWVDEALANDTLDITALTESPEQVRSWLTTWRSWGLWRDGRLLGMVRARRCGAEWHVGRLAVAPDVRGQGLGRWLLRAAEAAAESDCSELVLSTGARSRQNIAFYESEGYQKAPGADGGTVRLVKEVTVRELSHA